MCEKYNGWTNYATWRINLEICDDYVSSYLSDVEDGHAEKFASIGALADWLQEYTEEALTFDGTRDDSLAMSYAQAFLSQVDWYEIAAANAENLVRSDDEEDSADNEA